MRRLSSAKEETSKFKASFAVILLNSARSSQSADVAVQTTALEGKRKEISFSSEVTIKRRRANVGATMQSQYQMTKGVNSKTLLPPPPSPRASCNAGGV